ncbi:type IX secretion system sortase PorU [Cytophagaceae bacterium ABcell3]|nr:type IX secretion system sortase PorU [Cytophagaceae bacterium ABcell3]
MNRFRIILTFLFFLICIAAAKSQGRKQVTLNWNQSTTIKDENDQKLDIPSFEGAIHIVENNHLPLYQIKITGHISTFELENTTVDQLSEKEKSSLKDYKEKNYKTDITLGFQNKTPISFVRIIPIRYSESKGSYEKLTSFSYKYQKTSTKPLVEKKSETSHQTQRRGMQKQALTSVLSTGDWYKMRISESGIHKIDYEMLQQMGLNPSSIDPRKIQIYGNGGGMLPQANSDERYADLVENAIYVEGEANGEFNRGDYILFYAQGPHTWHYNDSEEIFNHTFNVYSDHAYYFLTVGSEHNGKRIANAPEAGTPAQTIATFDERVFHERDLDNILYSGREWYGELFDFTTQRNFNFNLPGIVAGTDIKITSAVMAASISQSRFSLSINNVQAGTQTISNIPNTTYGQKGRNARNIFTVNQSSVGSSGNLNISLSYDKRGVGSAKGYLNYLEINAKRALRLYGNQTMFRSIESTSENVSRFQIATTASGLRIWDITNHVEPLNQNFTFNGSQATFTTSTSELKEFIVFSGNNFSTPVFDKKISNQNLRGIAAGSVPHMVIVSGNQFMSQANKLAQNKRREGNLKVEVVSIEQVYNEFSSGSPDVTAIRDFMKLLYDRGSGADTLRYLLLFGDCSYDYKNIKGNGAGYVPVYQSRESLHNIFSYSSDDYFGFLDDNEGYWPEDRNSSSNHTLDISIGRLPVNNTSEAEAVVSKISHYQSNESLGNWRNRVTFVADDGDGNSHMRDAEMLSDKVYENHKEYNINKIFIDAYPQIPSPAGEIAPAVNEAIDQAIEKGTLIMNYSGHGGQEIWADERILDVQQIRRWRNMDNLAFFITATCDFGVYDDPRIQSGGEALVLSPNGGGIGIFSSTRPVYQSSNRTINLAIYEFMFEDLANNEKPGMGDVTRKAKNEGQVGVNNRNYALLGDPSLKLAYPQEQMVVTGIKRAGEDTDTLRALSKITIEGEIRNNNGGLLNDFNGIAHITVFEKMSTLRTYGTGGTSPMEFDVQRNFIYDGQASVSGGEFSVSFIVPKDISYNFGYGKISMYAQKEYQATDAHGHHSTVVIGGSDPEAAEDTTPPEIELFMNDESFVFGGVTNNNPKLIAKLFDESGINVAGTGVGHEITAVIDDKPNVIVLNDYYTAELDNFQKGRVEYPLRDLEEGNHSLKFKAWDTHNNPGDAYVEFIVATDEKLALKHILNYPNPFSTNTTFHFDHNRAGEDLDVLVQIYTVSGTLIRTLDGRCYACSSHFEDIHWDGRDDFGDKIGKGVYVYKVNVRSLRDGSSNFKYQKLVILN